MSQELEEFTHSNPVTQVGFAIVPHVITMDGSISDGALAAKVEALEQRIEALAEAKS